MTTARPRQPELLRPQALVPGALVVAALSGAVRAVRGGGTDRSGTADR